MLSKAGELSPGLTSVRRLEHRGVFNACVNRIRVGQRGLEMPDALELPRMWCSVVPLVSSWHAGVGEFVVDGLPGLAAVVRSLNHLAEPTGRLGGVNPIRISRRSLDVID